MGKMNLASVAQNVERFMNLLEIADDAKRTAIEQRVVSQIAAAQDQKPYLVYSNGTLSHYQNGTLLQTYQIEGASNRVLHCDGEKISILDRDAYLSGSNVVIIGTVAASVVAGAAIAAANGRRNENSTSVGMSSNNNNNKNNNNNNNNNG